MEENNKGFVIPERIEVVTKTVGQIAVTILIIRLICNVLAPRIIIVEKGIRDLLDIKVRDINGYIN